MTGANSAFSSALPPKPSSKSRRNAPHPTTRKRPRETLRLLGPEPGHFSSLVGVVVIARKLTYGNSVAIPAIAETKNTRRYREDSRRQAPTPPALPAGLATNGTAETCSELSISPSFEEAADDLSNPSFG